MPINKFKFVSPGVQLAEIDNSQLPALPGPMGPVIIGRAERGPGLRPVQINSMSDFVTIFGNPQPGGKGYDVWRNGGEGLSPTYGAYAAQAYLRNSSPVTYVRLLGRTHEGVESGLGEAGWQVGTVEGGRSGGAYGFFVMENASDPTGTLAAIFYEDSGSSLALLGIDPTTAAEVSGTCTLVEATSNNWKMQVYDTVAGASPSETIAFNFTETSKNYIRKVFNTNPTLTNNNITADPATYFLGESFDAGYHALDGGNGPGDDAIGILLPLFTPSNASQQQSVQRRPATKAETPWIISQDLGGEAESYNIQKLFKLKTLEAGAWEQGNFKISISNVKASIDPVDLYGSFTVEIRMADDSDNAKKIVERFSQCTLNPNSSNYVARRIGDMSAVWSDVDRRYREYGSFRNQSRYVYVVMNSDVENASTNETYLPFGFEAPVRWRCFSASTTALSDPAQGNFTTPTDELFVTGSRAVCPEIPTGIGESVQFSNGPENVSFVDSFTLCFPEFPLRDSSKEGRLSSPKDAYFGLDTSMASSTRFEKSYKDLVLPFGPGTMDAYGDPDSVTQQERMPLGGTDANRVFTLEDITQWETSAHLITSSTDVYFESGSRASGFAMSTTSSLPSGDPGNWSAVLSAGFDAFTLPLQGGFDGLNIIEAEPFNSSRALDSDATETNSYAWNSVKIAIDSCSDPEVVECNLMSMPGLINEGLTEHIIKICEDRADCLAVIDIEHGYTPKSENTQTEQQRGGNIDNAITALSERALNSSYGCCYYPWVQARDLITGQSFWTPPSVAAIGTFSSSQRKSEVWFAPAGFTRGGLTEGSAGIPVVNVKQKLTSKDRDKLYEVNINPIASFPAEGIVVFGQKTLQTTPSALDRVNVRRLMIFIKKEVSRIAARLLFDQNVQTTWDRFTGQVVPFLDSITARLGLTDYRVILDSTTTTPDLIDRNIMYAKIYLKPARAIEFIAIDFVITSTGASFED